MKWIVVGLGNPGAAYEKTRHNAGRIALGFFREKNGFANWREEKRTHALVSEGEIAGQGVTLIEPETYMNLSGECVKQYLKYPKDRDALVVVHDEMDLPLGTYKISYDRSSGGHNGVQSIIDHLGSQQFVRVRIGVSPIAADGTLKKPDGEDAVHRFIVGAFQSGELETLKKLLPEIAEAIRCILEKGHVAAQGQYN